jgi:CHAT domain-containing protein
MRGGADAFARGEFGAAEQNWKQADLLYARAGDTEGRLDAWFNLGAVQQQGGKFALAISTLTAAHDLAAAEGGRPDQLIGIKNALGVTYTFTRQPERAEEILNAALALLEEQGRDAAVEASVRNNLGNLYAAWAEVLRDEEKPVRYDAAFEQYARSAALAGQSGDAPLSAKATVNAALSAARGGRHEKADALNARAFAAVGALPDSLEKANLLVAVGQTDQTLLAPVAEPDAAKLAPDRLGRVQRRAFRAYEQGRELARRLDNPLLGSYAVGYQGRLYEMAGRNDEALTLTRRAVTLAQQAQSPDSLYLWQWQTGRLLRALGDTAGAIAAYTRARDTLEVVRSDLALGYGNRGMRATFRNEVGPLYYELADLLLTRADAEGDAAAVQQYLSDARDTVERLRVGELESYLEDPCVNQAQALRTDLTKDLGEVAGNPAVVYLIPLRDRVEILVTTKAGMRRVKSADVGAAQLTREVREFRRRLETRRNHRYLANARQLYTWLIRPIEPVLAEEGIDTLVFVPDGALRTVPMSALHDGTDFLIAKYAVAVSPGLSLRLTDDAPEDVSRGAARVLASGLSVSPPDSTFAPLPSVAEELETIGQIYGGTTLMNEAFLVPNFTRELGGRQPEAREAYSIVHIASHGVFAADVADTFVLTYDGRLNLNSLEALLRPYQLQGKPIDLLTLSACQTSAGDDQAALERASLGLGGLAVKAGARSAMASLWCANDQATSDLVTRFYEELRDRPDAGKADALRRAQLWMLRGEDFGHPVYWAPFLMIGDWL